MKKHSLLFSAVVLIYSTGFAQTPDQKLFHATGSTAIEKLIRLPNGNFTILSYDGLYSVNANGAILWSKEFPALSDGSTFAASSFVRNTDGSYLIAGMRQFSPNNYVSALIKTDATGQVLWSKQISDNSWSNVTAIIKTNDGGFALTGKAKEFIAGSTIWDAYIIKLDSNANLQWSRIIGSDSLQDYSNSIIQTSDSGYVITGYTYIDSAGDVFVAKVNSAGKLLWSKYFGDNGYDFGIKIINTNDGALVVLGRHGTVPLFGFTTDYFLVKLKGNGNLQWAKYYGGPDSDDPNDIIQLATGGYMITGTSYSFRNDFYSDIYTIKTNASGNVLFSKAVGNGGGNVILQNGSGFVVGGSDSTYPYPSDGLLIKTDNNLNTCNSRDVTTDVQISTRSVNANFHKKSRTFTISPLSFISINLALSVTQLCSSIPIAKISEPQADTKDFEISVFPNPVKDKLTLRFTGTQPLLLRLSIMDPQGNVFISKNVSIFTGMSTDIINTALLRNGNYFLAVIGEDGRKKLISFIKE
jgi:hypothetical protein